MTGTPASYRSPAAHDCDRILYSSAYRRLTGVTQVVAVGERQLFHNRLTHTQKVAQLSKRIAQHINWTVDTEAARSSRTRVDVDAAEAAGLAHDLGHPPFGHIAEHELNKKCRERGLDGFEGNAQTLRIVSKLSIRTGLLGNPPMRGLDLSPKTLEGILKYPWMSDHQNAVEKSKWGAYLTEQEIFRRIRAHDPTSVKQSIEAAVMDWADDISYAIHDLEDFHRAGFINIERLRSSAVLRREFVALAFNEYSGPPAWTEDDANEDFENLLNVIPTMPPFSGSELDRANINRLGSAFIKQYVEGAYVDENDNLVTPEIYVKEIHFLKQLTWQSVINDPSLATLQQGQIRVVGQLFDALFDWLKSEKRVQRLPTRLYDLWDLTKTEDYVSNDARDARAIADYISSLTEDQALDLHARLYGYTRGSIQDTWVAY